MVGIMSTLKKSDTSFTRAQMCEHRGHGRRRISELSGGPKTY
jgi:hypothetical protein